MLYWAPQGRRWCWSWEPGSFCQEKPQWACLRSFQRTVSWSNLKRGFITMRSSCRNAGASTAPRAGPAGMTHAPSPTPGEDTPTGRGEGQWATRRDSFQRQPTIEWWCQLKTYEYIRIWLVSDENHWISVPAFEGEDRNIWEINRQQLKLPRYSKILQLNIFIIPKNTHYNFSFLLLRKQFVI